MAGLYPQLTSRDLREEAARAALAAGDALAELEETTDATDPQWPLLRATQAVALEIRALRYTIELLSIDEQPSGGP